MVRFATKEDIGAIETLLEQVLLVHHNGRPDIFKECGKKYSREELEELIENEDFPVFVYEEDGKVLAHCFCKIIDREDTPATYPYKTLFIDDLCVLDTERGKHIGKKMMEYVRGWATGQGFYNITLHAWKCNPQAVEFYKALGMKVQQYTMEEILNNGYKTL